MWAALVSWNVWLAVKIKIGIHMQHSEACGSCLIFSAWGMRRSVILEFCKLICMGVIKTKYWTFEPL